MKKHRVEILFAPLFLFLSAFFLKFIFDIEYLKPAEQAITDFEMTDIAYEILEIERRQVAEETNTEIFKESDTNIVIIDIGKFSKKKLFYLLKVLNYYSPRAIGVHLVINEEGEEQFNDSLVSVCKEYPNIVFGSKLYNYSDKIKQYLQIKRSWGKFLQYTHSGFINIPFGKDKKINTVREFIPRTSVININEDAFATKMVEIIDKNAHEKLISRDNDEEYIHFYGNYQVFVNLSARQIFTGDFSPDLIRNKIILLGNAPVYEKYLMLDYMSYSPLSNFNYGKPYPDMYDVVVQANIIKMILDEDYYTTVPYFWTLIFTLFVIYLNFWLFFLISDKMLLWYEILSNVLFLFESILILILVFALFEEYKIYADLTTSLLTLALIVIVFEAYRDSVIPVAKKFFNKLKRGAK